MNTGSACAQLLAQLEDGEKIEGVVFGAWGWGREPTEGSAWKPELAEPQPPPVPYNKRGKLLRWEEAEPLMQSWSFIGGYGSPECYATYVWTNQRVFYVVQYDGSTSIHSIPRNPIECMPEMPGG